MELLAAVKEGDLVKTKSLIESQSEDAKTDMINSSDPSGMTPLHIASQEGHLELVKYFIDLEAKVSKRDNEGDTALHYASRNGHVDVIQCLVQKGSDLETGKDTPLYVASREGHVGVVEYLVKAGADVNKASDNGALPLYIAAYKGHLSIVRYLLEHGADIDMCNINGIAPLYTASIEGHFYIAQCLLNAGADVNKETKNGDTPLHAASRRGHIDIVKELTKAGADLNMTMNNETPLLAALRQGHIDIVKYLETKVVKLEMVGGQTSLYDASQAGLLDTVQRVVNDGADVNKATKNGDTPLHAASHEGHVDIVRCLVNAGADVNKATENGNTPLHAASRECHLNIVKYLITKGADPGVLNSAGETPLYTASQKGLLGIAECLVNAGADMNKATLNGDTPLHAATSCKRIDVLKYLVTKEATLDLGNNMGVTPFSIAFNSGHLHIADYLLSAGANGNKADSSSISIELLLAASVSGYIHIVKHVISKVSNLIDEVDEHGFTALYYASQEGHLGVVECLVNAGADVNKGSLYTPSYEGYFDIGEYPITHGAMASMKDDTPLSAASREGHIDIVEYLVTKGADVDKVNIRGVTPLHDASQEGHLGVVECLVNAEADVNKSSENGDTPLHAASRNRPSVDLVKYLITKGAKVDACNSEGVTPLHVASLVGNLKIVEYLVKAGANVNMVSNEGDGLLEAAERDGHADVAEYLSGVCKDVRSPADRREFQNLTHRDLAFSNGCLAVKNFDSRGGKLSTESHGFTLHIPPGALDDTTREPITLGVLTKLPDGFELQEYELLVSHGFQCFPSGLRFKKPATLTIPHCAELTDPGRVKMVFYSWNRELQGEPERILEPTNTCVVGPKCLEISITHFSGGYFAMIRDWLFPTSIRLSCMPFLPRAMPASRELVMEVRLVKKPKGLHWREIHELHESDNHRPVKDDDDVILFETRTPGLKISCEVGSDHIDPQTVDYNDIRREPKITRFFHLDLTDKNDETLVILNMIHTNNQTIEFNTRFSGAPLKRKNKNVTGESGKGKSLKRRKMNEQEGMKGKSLKRRKIKEEEVKLVRSAALSVYGEILDMGVQAPSTSQEVFGDSKTVTITHLGESNSSMDVSPSSDCSIHQVDEYTQSKTDTNLAEYHIVADIPTGKDNYKGITIHVIKKAPSELILKENEAIIAVGLKFSPPGLQLSTPVKVTLRHSAIFTNPMKANIILYTRNNDVGTFSEVSPSANGTSRCDVRQQDLDLYIDHFSEWWITGDIDAYFIGKRLICTPYIPVSIPRNRTKCIILCLKDDNNGPLEVIADYREARPGIEYSVLWEHGNVTIDYLINDKEQPSEVLEEREFYYLTHHHTDFLLKPTDWDELEVIVKLILSQYIKKKFMFPVVFEDKERVQMETVGTSPPRSEASHSPGEEDMVTDAHILSISKLLKPNDFFELHVALGIDYSSAMNIKSQTSDMSVQYIHLLQKWKANSPRTIRDLNRVLSKASAGGLVNRYLLASNAHSND